MWIKDETQTKSYRRSAGRGFDLANNNPEETHKKSGEKKETRKTAFCCNSRNKEAQEINNAVNGADN